MEDEHGALLQVEGVESGLGEGQSFALYDSLERRGIIRCNLIVEPHDFVPCPGAPPVSGGNPQRKSKQPRSCRSVGVELVQATMDSKEDVVGKILQIGLRDTEPAQGTPNVVEMPLIDLGEGRWNRILSHLFGKRQVMGSSITSMHPPILLTGRLIRHEKRHEGPLHGSATRAVTPVVVDHAGVVHTTRSSIAACSGRRVCRSWTLGPSTQPAVVGTSKPSLPPAAA